MDRPRGGHAVVAADLVVTCALKGKIQSGSIAHEGLGKVTNSLSDTENKNLSVDCKVGEWSAWEDCSATCGGGTKTKTMTVVQKPINNGTPCPPLKETASCNTEECPGSLLLLCFNIHLK